VGMLLVLFGRSRETKAVGMMLIVRIKCTTVFRD
jgi:hypothetical protein